MKFSLKMNNTFEMLQGIKFSEAFKKIKLPKMPANIPYYSLVGANVIAIALVVIFVFNITSFFSQKGEVAIEEGKRVVISVQTDEISIKQTEQKEEKKEEVEAASLENTGSQIIGIPMTGKPKLSIVIKSLGLSKSVTSAATELPPEITLSFSPYAKNANEHVKKALEAGHEALMDLPLETSDYPLSDPGPFALLATSGKARNLFRIKSALATAEGYTGVLSSPDENFTHSILAVIPIIDEIKNNEMVFIYNEKPSNIFLRKESKSIGLKTISNYVIIDEVPTQDAIDKKLDEIGNLVSGGKTILAVGHPYPVTIKRIKNWLEKQKENESITVASISKLTTKQDDDEL